jgi:ferredoxin
MPEQTPTLPEIDQSLCIHCGACAAVCVSGALSDDYGKPEITSPLQCTHCAECEETCPVGAITVPFTIGWA